MNANHLSIPVSWPWKRAWTQITSPSLSADPENVPERKSPLHPCQLTLKSCLNANHLHPCQLTLKTCLNANHLSIPVSWPWKRAWYYLQQPELEPWILTCDNVSRYKSARTIILLPRPWPCTLTMGRKTAIKKLLFCKFCVVSGMTWPGSGMQSPTVKSLPNVSDHPSKSVCTACRRAHYMLHQS